MKKFDILQAIVWKEGDDYVAQCLNVDISSYGSTKAEALASLKEALHLYFEDERGEITEVDRPELVKLRLGNA